jgi:hypothetical protein
MLTDADEVDDVGWDVCQVFRDDDWQGRQVLSLLASLVQNYVLYWCKGMSSV